MILLRVAAPRPSPRDQRRLALRDAGVRAEHRRQRPGLWSYARSGDAPTLLTAPLVYSVVIPLVVLDLWVGLYQAVCFRAWGIERVRRRPYVAIDRHKLAYLNAIEKVHCLFCSYANGVIGFVREVAARSEQYWCPIRHARHIRQPHERYAAFAGYGDAAAYRRDLPRLRVALRK